jgi:hypothetical protein
MVLTTLWQMFHVYSRLFESGGIQARQARLVTALQRQFADDLQSAIEDSPRPNDAATSSSVRRFGLQGSAHTLRFDVLQMLPDDQLPASEEASSIGRTSAFTPQAPELKTVVYRFVSRHHSSFGLPGESAREETTASGNEPSAEGALPRPGLTRWELDFETPLEKNAARPQPAMETTDDADVQAPSTGTTSGAGGTGGASFEDMAAQAAAPEAMTWLPEVRRATFRYFDGRSWSDSWNSLQRGSLPMAVEVRLRLRDPAEANRRQRPKDEPESTTEETEDSSDETSSDAGQPTRPFEENGLAAETPPSTYRFLIRLPIAQHGPELKVASASALGSAAPAEENPPLAPPPSLFPPPSPPSGPTEEHPDSSLPDQWLRTVP